MERLNGKRVLAVGASRGVGRAIGAGLAGEGARVAFAARSAAGVQEAAAKAGGDALAVTMDVPDEKPVQAAVAEVIDAFGGLDALIYAPAYGPLRRLRDADA